MNKDLGVSKGNTVQVVALELLPDVDLEIFCPIVETGMYYLARTVTVCWLRVAMYFLKAFTSFSVKTAALILFLIRLSTVLLLCWFL